MGKRHDAIGIKQVVRPEWYDYALDMLLDHRRPPEIRRELDGFIGERLQRGGYGQRGEQTYAKAVTQIMKSWVSPDRELIPFRDRVLLHAGNHPREDRIVLHWIVTIAAYPFWHRVAEQVGRLLNLQDSITQGQIRLRCFEAMGERSTVERSARRVIRSFVAWKALRDSGGSGCYEKMEPPQRVDNDLAVLMLEASLHAIPQGRASMDHLMNNPALFPFRLPPMADDFVSCRSENLEVARYGPNDAMLKLKG